MSLLINEDTIYCSKQIEYSLGKFYGNFFWSVAGKYRDVITMPAFSNLNAGKQYTLLFNIMSVLTELGFYVVQTITDGNNVNVTFFKTSCNGTLKPWINTPFRATQMHLMFNPVHLFKWFHKN